VLRECGEGDHKRCEFSGEVKRILSEFNKTKHVPESKIFSKDDCIMIIQEERE
jgi:hypothetical protein